MDLHPQQHGSVRVLQPRGRIDHTHADSFKLALDAELAALGSGALLIDFSGIDYISSIGLRALMLAQRQAKAQGATLALAGLSPLVQEVFTISRFDLVFKIFARPAEALTHLGGAA